MRYDTPVYFQYVRAGEYDAESGNYLPDKIAETMVYASVSDTGAEMVQMMYGQLREGCLTVRLQNHFTKPFSNLRIGEKIYRVDRSRMLRTKQTLFVCEVQRNA